MPKSTRKPTPKRTKTRSRSNVAPAGTLKASWRKLSGIQLTAVVALVVGLGVFVVWSVFAGTIINNEPESFTTSSSAGIVTRNDPTAANGQYLEFLAPSAPSTPPPTTGNSLTNFFPIGVWQQNANTFATWKSRGINTMFNVEDGSDPVQWSNAIATNGLKMFRKPLNPLSQDASFASTLLARSHEDEPDLVSRRSDQISYQQIQTDYAAMKAALPNNPVIVNFVGDLNQFDVRGPGCLTNGQPTYNANCESGPEWYKKYIAGADWVSADKYPINSCQPITRVEDTIKKLRSWTEKPVMIILEANDFDTTDNCPGPNADQLRGQIWLSIASGVRGIFYFPQRVIGGYIGDNTPAAVAAEMTTQNKRITALTAVLQPYPVNPATLNATTPSALRAGWRDTPNGKYFFVVNTTASNLTSQSIALSGIGAATTASVVDENRNVSISAGKIIDNFGPYAVHIYKIN